MKFLTLAQAQQLILHCQGLGRNGFGKGKKASLRAIEHLGYVQIDTLAVVERAHHHTLWTRNKGHRNNYLEELVQKDKTVFEYWSHAASYLPMKDYRFSLVRKEEYAKGRDHWFGQDKKVMKKVLERIQQEGALMSKDFENPANNKGVWYDWKPAKKALEQLFMDGTLMVSGRKGFQKIYDTTERVLPEGTNTSLPTPTEYADHLIISAIRANGLVNEKEITYLRTKYAPLVKKRLPQLLKKGVLLNLKVEGMGEEQYTFPGLLKFADVQAGEELHILSPFDNLLIQRKRMEKFFGFSYFVECYVPEHKRVHGYFCLPLLYGSGFIGRADMKADRQSGILIVKKLILEPGVIVTEQLLRNLEISINDFAAFNGCEAIRLEATNQAGGKVDRKLKNFLS